MGWFDSRADASFGRCRRLLSRLRSDGVATTILTTLALGGVTVAVFCTGAAATTDALARVSAAGTKTVTLDRIPPSRSLVCRLPRKAKKLAPTSRHGLVGHLLQYPAVGLATPTERARAQRVLAQLLSAAQNGNWSELRAVRRAGYRTRTAVRKAGDRSVHYFHAERAPEPGRPMLDARRPKALIYANTPGRPLVLVGAMWSTRDGVRGPTPAGPILRWHSHMICLAEGTRRGLKPPANGKCSRGSRLVQGRREMLHVWFTRGLRSAFAIRAPEPELCAGGLLPRGYCRRFS
jgi:hypothetical protein